MTMLADDPTAAAVLAAVPCYPVPPQGRSPALDALRKASSGHGLAVGSDGVMLVRRRPWLALDVPMVLWASLWQLHVDAFAPGLFSPLLLWLDFVQGGGRMALGLVCAGDVLAAARTLGERGLQRR